MINTKKSKNIIFLAIFQAIFICVQLFLSFYQNINLTSNLFFILISIFLLADLFILFSKDSTTYKISASILVLGYIVCLLFVIFMEWQALYA